LQKVELKRCRLRCYAGQQEVGKRCLVGEMQAQEVKRETCHLAAYLEVALVNLSAEIIAVN